MKDGEDKTGSVTFIEKIKSALISVYINSIKRVLI
jgi:hypothetical protein